MVDLDGPRPEHCYNRYADGGGDIAGQSEQAGHLGPMVGRQCRECYG